MQQPPLVAFVGFDWTTCNNWLDRFVASHLHSTSPIKASTSSDCLSLSVAVAAATVATTGASNRYLFLYVTEGSFNAITRRQILSLSLSFASSGGKRQPGRPLSLARKQLVAVVCLQQQVDGWRVGQR